jgi:hypothetical protein
MRETVDKWAKLSAALIRESERIVPFLGNSGNPGALS